MNYQKTFIITIISLQIFSSCQDDIKDLDNTNPENRPTLLSTKSRDDDIDGGTLPEVVVTANRLEYASDFDGSGGGGGGFGGGGSGWYDPQDWWYPPLNDDAWSHIIGGGGGGSYANPPQVTLSANLLKLFPKGSNLGESDLEKLNSEYKKMLEDCTYKALNQLLLDGNYSGSKIFYNPDGLGNAGINRTGSLTFADAGSINSTNLAHEWTHLCQRYLRPDIWGDSQSFDKYYGMMEYELEVFKDIVWMLKYGQSISQGEEVVPLDSWVNQIQMDKDSKGYLGLLYAFWLYGNFGQGVVPEHFNTAEYYQMSYYFFNKVPSNMNRGMKCEESYGVSTMETLLRQVYNNCIKK